MFYTKIAEVAKEDPKRLAIVCGSEETSYGELYHRISDAMYHFINMHIKEADIVMVELTNPDSFVQNMITLMSLGAVPFAIPPSVEQTKHRLIEPVHPQFMMTDTDFYSTNLPSKHKDKLGMGDVIHFTSGSSGPQKLVIRPRKNLLDEANGIVAHLGLNIRHGKVLVMTPLAHSFGCGIWRACMLAGATLIVPNESNISARLSEIRAIIEAYQPDFIFGVPYLFQVLSRHKHKLSHQPRCFAGGETLFPATANQWLKSTGIPLQQEYGLGEGGITTMALPNSLPSCLGAPIPGVRLSIANPGADGVGELIVYRNHAPKAYLLEGPADTFMLDGGIRTGDLVSHEDGDYFFHGRLKSIIVVAGLKVTTLEIEDCIRRLPQVEDVAVLAGKDALTGERPVAFVELKTPANAELIRQNWLKEGLEPMLEEYKIPKHVVVLPKLPRTASGKVDRNALRV